MRRDDDGSVELPLSDEAKRRTATHAASGVGAGEAALRVSAIACAVATKWRTGEPQEVTSDLSRGGTHDSAEEAQTLRARGTAAASLDRCEPGMGFRFRA